MVSRKVCIAFLLLVALRSVPGRADVTQKEIDAAIRRARSYVAANIKSGLRGEDLAVYTLVKSGTPANDPLVIRHSRVFDGYFKSGEFVSGRDHYYTAGVVALYYDALGGEKYKQELQMIAKYVLKGQHSNGAWFYPGSPPNANVGDTSISQYALLALWTASRAGIEIPEEAWGKAADWLASTQLNNGGFVYHPGGQDREAGVTRPSLVSAGGSSMALCMRMLYPHGIEDEAEEARKPLPAEKFKTYGGILEIVDISEPLDEPVEPLEKEKWVSSSTLKKKYERSLGLIGGNSSMGLAVPNWRMYYLYGLERFAAFAGEKRIGSRDWYQFGAEFLLKIQEPDGSWKGEQEDLIGTCFGILFLTKATAKTIRPPKPPEPKIGSGLLAGGRGLPSDLRDVEQKDGKIMTKSTAAPVADLLSQLESSATTKLIPLQKEIIEQVHKGQREALVGQTERLLKLLKSPDPEVRKIAVWALARGTDTTQAPVLINLIRNDPHFDVAREAYAGLCILSRRLQGVGLSLNPLKGLKADDTGREAKARQWRAEAAKRWEDWYLTVRPYQERDDLQDLN
ncbi:MAG: HEAT repeat domain-containing protein [Planctomycetaceae bacterium]|nr:HEAT repeat domain-containing protein [Planctomycetaceae bacterium]